MEREDHDLERLSMLSETGSERSPAHVWQAERAKGRRNRELCVSLVQRFQRRGNQTNDIMTIGQYLDYFVDRP